jgi:hypothetical protein
MTPARFESLIAAYGADPARWPAAERAAAEALLARAPELRARTAQAAALDTALDRWPSPAPPALDAEQLAARVSAMPQGRVVAFRPRRRAAALWPNAAGLAAAALAGFLIGWSGLDSNLLPPREETSTVALIIEEATW